MKSEIMIMVRDVEGSSAWYQRLLGARSGHGGKEYERIVADGQLLLQLHRLEAEEHPALARAEPDAAGSGVLIYVYVDDVNEAYQRARDMETEVIDEPHLNPQAGLFEFSLRDPDGYSLTICRDERT